jgi:hypothetical protein
MKTVYLATCYFQANYGSVLQAYATQEFLNNNSIENITINISGLESIIKKRKLNYFMSNLFNKDIISDKAAFVELLLHKKINKELKNKIDARERAFRDFYTTHFRLTEPFSSFEQLGKKCSEICSAVLVGSDQLWLPTNIEADYYTLNFAPDNVKRISFATSFGVSKLPKKQADKAKAFLNNFSAISVREYAGQKLVGGLIGKIPDFVCDPVALINSFEWARLCLEKKATTDKYIFTYLLGKDQSSLLWTKNLSRLTGYRIIGFANFDSYISIEDEFFDELLYDS